MADEPNRQSIIDEEHLQLLKIGYLVSGCLTALFSLFALFYVGMGIFMALTMSHAAANPGKGGEAPPAFIGWIFAVFGGLLFLALVSMAIARFWVARCLSRRQSRTFCLVIAGIGCLEFPYGMLLGVATFVVLVRDSVTRLFTPVPPAPSG